MFSIAMAAVLGEASHGSLAVVGPALLIAQWPQFRMSRHAVPARGPDREQLLFRSEQGVLHENVEVFCYPNKLRESNPRRH